MLTVTKIFESSWEVLIFLRVVWTGVLIVGLILPCMLLAVLISRYLSL
jgi:hypothetical protein